ncbi:uncharacterized protein AKAME5_001992100 [Lates japonicus]|uniref:BEN domain-containing protein n=1 Tax=Lates japonicus TaxID=270547 RepID=A0AAD3N8L9_LATJO|nr:uncharacterized protein AKAME5_001992100 [Lates japonicus]
MSTFTIFLPVVMSTSIFLTVIMSTSNIFLSVLLSLSIHFLPIRAADVLIRCIDLSDVTRVKADSYKELVSKKNLFFLGKDIWAEEESRGVHMKKRPCEADVVKPKIAVQKRALDTQDDHCSSEDESPQYVHGGKRAKINKAARRVLLPLASSPSSDDATYIGSPQRHDIELAVLVFTKEGLAQSTITGKSGRGTPPKTQLDVVKVQAITDAVRLEFPQTSVSDVRTAIRRKSTDRSAPLTNLTDRFNPALSPLTVD